MTETVSNAPLFTCPRWCQSHMGEDRTHVHLTDLTHLGASVGYNELVTRTGVDPVFHWQLGAFSEEDGRPGRPFVIMGPDSAEIDDARQVGAVLTVLEEAVEKLRYWHEVMAAYESEHETPAQ